MDCGASPWGSAPLILSPERIDLWFVFFDEQWEAPLLAEYRCLLTADEREQETRFYFARDRVRYLITRALVRTVLSRYAAVRPEDWRFASNPYGRPQIVNGLGFTDPISFNISHTAGLILLGIGSRCQLGVDVENVSERKAPLDLADSYFSPGEAAALRALPEADQRERFFEYWTLKESYIKARSMGLSIPLDRFSFELSGSASIEVRFEPELGDNPFRWRFWQIRPSGSYMAAVCAQRLPGAAPQLAMRRVVPLVSETVLEYPAPRKSDLEEEGLL